MDDESKLDFMSRTKVSLTQNKIWCLVTQRDNVCFSFKFKEDAKGQDVMDEVCNKLGIVEKDYFGLQYTNSRGEIHWLNMRNRISRQINKPEPFSLMFCVKFYVQPHQLLQESTRWQFFLNVKEDLLAGKYHEVNLPYLYALLSQAEAGDFCENHISYNPSRCSHWLPEFRSEVIIEHCKLQGMSKEAAQFFLLKEVAESDDYGMEHHYVRLDSNNKPVFLGIGIDCLKLDKGNDLIERVPFNCLRMATRSGKTVKLDICSSDIGDIVSIVYQLNSKDSAQALYRSITEHHAFYRCDSIRPAVKQQVARDFFDTFLSWLPSDHMTEQNYIFDTERTCTEAYDHARRILYNFGSSAAATIHAKNDEDKTRELNELSEVECLRSQVIRLTNQVEQWKESFNCSVCRDRIIDVVLECGHTICFDCSELCKNCPFCRNKIKNKTKFFLGLNHIVSTSEDNLLKENIELSNEIQPIQQLVP
ncbi:E3 ubiquitin-protein ligase MYLIP [Hydra vulgaris]|uniref:E3 ubiquitin-protein ligase MYLIP n=1 Tax=Hydra vulgaris TaxID=6087 RepID=UPI0001923E61|nr:E3 ubiquitin-protein ligase MYLIP [Hydra vulgaris]